MEYVLGNIQIDDFCLYQNYRKNKDLFDFDEDYDDKNHLFVLNLKMENLSFHIGSKSKGNSCHERLADRYSRNNVIGGGCMYIDKKIFALILDNYSGDYGAVPSNILNKFGELLCDSNHQSDYLPIKKVIVNPFEEKIRKIWDEFSTQK